MNNDEIYFYEPIKLTISGVAPEGYILDIGGGGEGIIGRLKGSDVISIDICEDELIEAPEGPLKILMDARKLKFLDNSFSSVTAFFSLMYFNTTEDLKRAFSEAFRVLKHGGCFHMWDVTIKQRPDTDKPVFAVRLQCRIKDQIYEAAYGRPWPEEERTSEYYRELLEALGFQHIKTEISGCTFYSCYRK